MLSLRKRKKKRKRKNSPSLLPYSPSLVFFLTREISERAIYIKSRKLSLHSFSLSLSLTRLGVNLLRNSRRIPRRALGVFAVSRAASQQGDKFARCFFLYFPFLFSLLSLSSFGQIVFAADEILIGDPLSLAARRQTEK